MKMQYKKLVIIISVATLLLGFFILTLIPGGKSTNDASDAELLLNENPEINNLVAEYFTAKKTVDIESFESIVSDVAQIDKTKFSAMAAYVEDYRNINCYVIENYATSDIFVPLCNVPEEIRNWQSREQGDINDIEQGIIFEKIAQIGDTNKYHAVFSMPYHAQQFFVDVPIKDTFKHTMYYSTRMYPCAMQTFYDITSLQDKVYTKALSVTSYGTTIWIFHSEYHPEILDLEQEVERSNLS